MPGLSQGRGALAIVLHSHMPYVEGFGTYPFGEEWLFDAVARSYLPVLEVARELTITVTPVLADQLEAPGVARRMRDFLVAHRLEAARRDAEDGPAELADAAGAEAARYLASLRRLDALGGEVAAAFAAARRDRGVELVASCASHAVLPMLASREGRRLQIDAGLRSHRRRFGPGGGFWLPECAYAPGLEGILAEAGLTHFCVDQSAHEDPLDALAPIRTAAGPAAFAIDWPTVERAWSGSGYPSDPVYADYHRLSVNGHRLWAIGGGPYDPATARRRAGDHAADFVEAVAERLGQFEAQRGKPGLVVFAVDTELLGHWWSEGPAWLDAVLDLAQRRGMPLVTLTQALEAFEQEPRPLRAASWGADKDLSTWDSPDVADLAWAARRLELRLLREVAGGRLSREAAERAARELLAVQASDWAFLDKRGEAGDYSFRRAVSHAQSFLEVIDSRGPQEPRMRNLAPDLSLAPLLEP